MAWNARVKVEGQRDGLASVQVIPGSPVQVVAQTFAGAVYLFDADNGDLIWKTKVGVPYWASQPAGFNSQSIFVTRRNILHVINRFTGVQRVFSYNAATKDTNFGFEMDYTPSAAPVADEELLHVNMGDRTQAFILPDFERIERIKRAKAQGKKETAKGEKTTYADDDANELDLTQPLFFWEHRITPLTTEFPPLIYNDQISFLTTTGLLFAVSRYERGPRLELFEFKMNGRVGSAAGQYNNIAYVGADDYNLYAIDISSNNGRLVWRYVGGAPIMQKPEVNDRDIFIAPERLGLRLLDRVSGREVWTNRDASRFLAANDNFVYALDHVGKFYVLDGRRGSTLAKYDLIDWAIPVPNEWTDRVYLAANDGQIMCLRHRDLTKPLTMKSPEVIKKKEVKKVEEKKEEKIEEEKKEEKKDVDKKKDAEKKDAEKKDAEKRTLGPRKMPKRRTPTRWDDCNSYPGQSRSRPARQRTDEMVRIGPRWTSAVGGRDDERLARPLRLGARRLRRDPGTPAVRRAGVAIGLGVDGGGWPTALASEQKYARPHHGHGGPFAAAGCQSGGVAISHFVFRAAIRIVAGRARALRAVADHRQQLARLLRRGRLAAARLPVWRRVSPVGHAGMGAAIWIHALAAIPWITFIVGLGLTSVEPELEDEAAQIVGPWRVLMLVTLPRVRASILAAGLFVVLQTASEISVTDMMLISTLAEEIHTQFTLGDRAALARTLVVSLPSLLLVWVALCRRHGTPGEGAAAAFAGDASASLNDAGVQRAAVHGRVKPAGLDCGAAWSVSSGRSVLRGNRGGSMSRWRRISCRRRRVSMANTWFAR